jgi:uncharacterized protein with beta-barrel porin domain
MCHVDRLSCRALSHLVGAALAITACLLSGGRALAQCAPVGFNQTCTNPAGTTMSGGGSAIFDFGSLTLTNFGTISGNPGDGVDAVGNSTVTNFGTIFGGTTAINITANLTLINYGTITGVGVAGVNAANSLSLVNYGTISGPSAVIASNSSVLTNAGTLIGTNGGFAIDFSFSNADTITLLPGSRIIGFINLGGGDVVNIQSGHDIAWMLTFGCTGCGGLVNTGSVANVTGGAPYVINGDQVATLDPTGFGLSDRLLMNFTSNLSSILGNRFGELSSSTSATSAAVGYASGTAPATAISNAPALASIYAASDGGIPSTSVFDRKSGITAWSKGFIGSRTQEANGILLASSSNAYGGMVGVDKRVNSDLWLGTFFGAGKDNTSVALSSLSLKTDYVFGGMYGRYDRSVQFFDFALTGGHTTTSSTRQVANNLVPTGLETATASYDGWFLSPELAYGYRIPLPANFTVTPIARLRYVVGHFDAYSETGSAQNLSVASRTAQNIEERLELQLSHSIEPFGGALQTTVTVGALGQQRVGATTINTILIGQNLAFAAPGENDVAGGYFGFGINLRVAGWLTVFAAAEATAMSDKTKTGIAQAGLRASF